MLDIKVLAELDNITHRIKLENKSKNKKKTRLEDIIS